MGSPPSVPGFHQQVNVSFSGERHLKISGFPGGDCPRKSQKLLELRLRCTLPQYGGARNKPSPQHELRDAGLMWRSLALVPSAHQPLSFCCSHTVSSVSDLCVLSLYPRCSSCSGSLPLYACHLFSFLFPFTFLDSVQL